MRNATTIPDEPNNRRIGVITLPDNTDEILADVPTPIEHIRANSIARLISAIVNSQAGSFAPSTNSLTTTFAVHVERTRGFFSEALLYMLIRSAQIYWEVYQHVEKGMSPTPSIIEKASNIVDNRLCWTTYEGRFMDIELRDVDIIYGGYGIDVKTQVGFSPFNPKKWHVLLPLKVLTDEKAHYTYHVYARRYKGTERTTYYMLGALPVSPTHKLLGKWPVLRKREPFYNNRIKEDCLRIPITALHNWKHLGGLHTSVMRGYDGPYMNALETIRDDNLIHLNILRGMYDKAGFDRFNRSASS